VLTFILLFLGLAYGAGSGLFDALLHVGLRILGI